MPTPWKDRWSTIVKRIRIVHSADHEAELLGDLASGSGPRIVAFVNAHAMNGAVSDTPFFDAIADADVLLRDGSGMAILYRVYGSDPGLNMNGTDFIPALISTFRGRRAAFWGTREPWNANASLRCEQEYGVRVVSVEHGFLDARHYVELARTLKPDLIVLGMGMPKQEYVARELRASAGGAPLIVCGGAILDFLGGKVSRAPGWMRSSHVEWIYRLSREPRRMFRRYIRGNPEFLVRLAAWHRQGSPEDG